jgi:hypothetical protein
MRTKFYINLLGAARFAVHGEIVGERGERTVEVALGEGRLVLLLLLGHHGRGRRRSHHVVSIIRIET